MCNIKKLSSMCIFIMISIFLASCNSGGGASSVVKNNTSEEALDNNNSQQATVIANVASNINPQTALPATYVRLFKEDSDNETNSPIFKNVLGNTVKANSTSLKNVDWKFQLIFYNNVNLTWDNGCPNSPWNGNPNAVTANLWCYTNSNNGSLDVPVNSVNTCELVGGADSSQWMRTPQGSNPQATFNISLIDANTSTYHVSCTYTW